MEIEQKNKKNVWVEKTIVNGENRWAIHYVKNNTEYKIGKFFTKKAAIMESKRYK